MTFKIHHDSILQIPSCSQKSRQCMQLLRYRRRNARLHLMTARRLWQGGVGRLRNQMWASGALMSIMALPSRRPYLWII